MVHDDISSCSLLYCSVDKLYDQLWEEDRLKKDKRAELDETAQRDRNREQLLLLDQQMVKIRESKQQEVLLRQQEEELRVSFLSTSLRNSH